MGRHHVSNLNTIRSMNNRTFQLRNRQQNYNRQIQQWRNLQMSIGYMLNKQKLLGLRYGCCPTY
jgi:hypothetical protein